MRKHFLIKILILLIIGADILGVSQIPTLLAPGKYLVKAIDAAETEEEEADLEIPGEDLAVEMTEDIVNQLEIDFLSLLEADGQIPRGLADLNRHSLDLHERLFNAANFDRIFFKNPIDEFIVFGEPCVPADQSRWLCTASEGNLWIRGGQDRLGNHFDPHPESDIFPNGVWDGPSLEDNLATSDPRDIKALSLVDSRILELLRYLTTPTWEGGAGRERITVSRIMQYTQNDKEVKTEMPEGQEPDKQLSSHYIGEIKPGNRLDLVIKSIDISAIDSARITTKIKKKRRVGNDKTSYKFQRPFEIKVAWQSDKGIDEVGLPPVDVLTGAEDFFNAGIIDLLSDFEITEALSPDDLKNVSVSDIAQFVGGEILASILESPRGSLDGVDLGDSLNRFGRFVVADSLGLPREAFAQGNNLDEIERSIGQYTLEERFNLPYGSFDGTTAADILVNSGRRWLEDEIFEVFPGTLAYDVDALADDTAKKKKFFERLGAGKLASVFNFKDNTLYSDNLSDEVKNSLRYKLIFKEENDHYIDEKLAVVITNLLDNAPIDGRIPDSALSLTKQFREGSVSFNHYKAIIGERVFQSSLGLLNQSVPGPDQLVDYLHGEDGQLNGILNNANQETAVWYQYRLSLRDDPDSLETVITDPLWPVFLSAQEISDLVSLYHDTSGINPDLDDVIDSGSEVLVGINQRPFFANVPGEQFDENGYSQHDYATILNYSRLLVGDPNVPEPTDVEGRSLLKRHLSALLTASKKAKSCATQSECLPGVTLSDSDKEKLVKFNSILDSATNKLYQYIEAVSKALVMRQSSAANEALNLTPAPNLYSLNLGIPSDLVAHIRSGKISDNILKIIGAVKISQKSTTNPRGQAQVQVDHFSNAQSFFDNLENLGVSETHLNGQFNLINGDYDRLFLRNMSGDVFERIGQAELLAAVWRQPIFQDQINRLRQSQDYQSLENWFSEANQTLDFYLSRVTNLAGIATALNDKVIALDDNIESHFGPSWRNVTNDFDGSTKLQSVGSAREFVTSLETNVGTTVKVVEDLKQLPAVVDSDVNRQAVNSIAADLARFRHIMQEIALGQELNYQSPENLVNPNSSFNPDVNAELNKSGRCWASANLVGLFSSEEELGSKVSDYMIAVGGCELDFRLYLPTGSLYNFYSSENHSQDDLFYSVGQADLQARKQPIPGEAEVRTLGSRIITEQVIKKIAASSSIFSNITDKYNITPEDIFAMISGQTEAVAIKIGGNLIDSRLHLTPGTSAGLINPCAAGDVILGRDCQNKDDREEIRTHLLAREGLRQLGLDMDIPLGVDIAHGSFKDNLGIQKLESVFGLELSDQDHHPIVDLDEIINANGIDKTSNAFGLPARPFTSLLAELELTTRQALNQLSYKPYLGDVTNQPIAKKLFSPKVFAADSRNQAQKYNDFLKAIDLLQNKQIAEKNELMEQVRNDTNFYLWWDQSRLPGITPDYQPVVDEIQKIITLGSDDTLISYLPEQALTILDNLEGRINSADLYREWADAFKVNVIRFQSHIEALDRAADLGAYYPNLTSIDPSQGVKLEFGDYNYQGTTEDVVQAKADGRLPQTIMSTKDILRNGSLGNLPDDYGKVAVWRMGIDLVSQKFAGTFIGKALADYDQFRQVVGQDSMPSLEQIFSGQAERADFDWAGLFTTTCTGSDCEKYNRSRGWFFDRFLANTFSAKFEENMGVETGTLRNLFSRPYLAKEIAVDQGMARIASELFHYGNDDSRDQRDLRSAMNQIFKAGFMLNCADSVNLSAEQKAFCRNTDGRTDYGRDIYTLKFDRKRAFLKFREIIDNKLQAITRASIGTPIPLADVNAIIRGDMNTLTYVAAAYTVSQINQAEDGQNIPANRLVPYSVARLATVGDPDDPAVMAASNQAAYSFYSEAFNTYCIEDAACLNGQTEDDVIGAISRKDGLTIEEAQKSYQNGRANARHEAERKANSEIRDQAKKDLQYRMMDLAMFKLDEDIPVGFAESFLSKDEERQTDVLLLYGLKKLTHNSEWAQIIGTNINLNTVGEFRRTLTGLSSDDRNQFFTTLATSFNGALKDYVNTQFNELVTDTFGITLEYGAENLFNGLLSWGATGSAEGRLQVGVNDDGSPRELVSLKMVAEDWASNRIFRWADSKMGFDVGTAQLLYENSRKLYTAARNYAYIRSHTPAEIAKKGLDPDTVKANLKQASAEFVTFAITTIFKTQIANVEQKLGLVPGTGAIAVGMIVNLIIGVPIDPITIALFIGLNLFGYYKVVVTSKGTADGYYPYKGQYGDYTIGGTEISSVDIADVQGRETGEVLTQTRITYFQYPSPDSPIGEFDPKDPAAYRSGIKIAAKAKIEGLLTDIATAPERWSAKTGQNMFILLPSQLFTMQVESVEAVAPFTSRPICTNQQTMAQNGGCGYGPVAERDRSGFFGNEDPNDTSFWDHVHIGY